MKVLLMSLLLVTPVWAMTDQDVAKNLAEMAGIEIVEHPSNAQWVIIEDGEVVEVWNPLYDRQQMNRVKAEARMCEEDDKATNE